LIEGLKRISRSRSLALAVASLTLFDVLATLALIDVLLLARTELALGDATAGTVPAFAAFGAILGALSYAYLTGKTIELGLTPVAGLGIAASLGATSVADGYWSLGGALLALGFFGGLFVVPFMAWIQRSAAAGEKGLIISTANFLDMAGVLGASGLLGILHSSLGFDPRTVLVIAGFAACSHVVLLLVFWKRIQFRWALLLRSLSHSGRGWRPA
jgi:acyl-[acyl-carrier-protein]-phospholipid O-acyltransferase/long-chain-fatty-acid--[acyl-carrier-protein] ligase